ncbi:hypothetical protein C8Q73DRAFT_794537 [Cubamyces lactineus]|nr:hypothetical protein C8Q73DRAFT_794537 [Cubamyces lactineus]
MSELTFSDLGEDPTYMFGNLNNPQAYCFEFLYDGITPAFNERPTIYKELLLYAQICKDYRWRGVETVILWIRARNRAVQNANSSVETLVPPEELSDFGFRSISLDEEVAAAAHPESTTHSGDSQYTLMYNLDFAFPELPGEFPEIPLDTPRVVVFDLSGVILDREQTIRRALSDWLPLTHRFQTMDEILSVYIEIEALAARMDQAVATSVAVIVDSALRTLASKLKIPLQSHPTLVTTSLVEIMNPRPCPDVEHAIASLSAHGRPVIVIPPHSEVSTRHFLSFIPRSQAKDVLLVITDVARKVAPASLADHPTPLVKRPGTTIASDVESS